MDFPIQPLAQKGPGDRLKGSTEMPSSNLKLELRLWVGAPVMWVLIPAEI